MESAAYDQMAVEYKKSKELSFRIMIEEYSLFKMTGDVSGKRVLDLACGEGHYSRKLREAGASEVVGVDVSHKMIKMAEAKEQENPIGCRYLASDVAKMPKMDQFDMATAMYLFNYAKSKEDLVALLKSIYDQLKPGAQLVGFNDNVANDPAKYPIYRKYGFVKETSPYRVEGDPIHYTFYNDDGSICQFDNYYLHPSTYAEAFREAGFVNFQWVWPSLHPTERGNDHWDDFMYDPPVIGFVAYKEEDIFRHRRSYVGWAVQNVWML